VPSPSKLSEIDDDDDCTCTTSICDTLVVMWSVAELLGISAAGTSFENVFCKAG